MSDANWDLMSRSERTESLTVHSTINIHVQIIIKKQTNVRHVQMCFFLELPLKDLDDCSTKMPPGGAVLQVIPTF